MYFQAPKIQTEQMMFINDKIISSQQFYRKPRIVEIGAITSPRSFKQTRLSLILSQPRSQEQRGRVGQNPDNDLFGAHG